MSKFDKRIIAIFLIAVLVISGIILLVIFSGARNEWACKDGQWMKYGNSEMPKPNTRCGNEQEITKQGVLTEIATSSTEIKTDDGQEFILVFSKDMRLFGKDGGKITPSEIRKGFRLAVTGIVQNQNEIRISEIRIIEEPNIKVYSPEPGDSVGLPLIIRGEARVFENTFSYRIIDADGTIIYENNAMANSPDMEIYGQFEVSANYPKPKGAAGTVEVFEYSAKDGSEINKVTVPVQFENVASLKVKVFFSNNKQDPGAMQCNKVYPVERRIPVTLAVAQATLKELLSGPDALEAKEGNFTSI
ncbi:MAG: Gmad2 immunoglobulin-like domain-containing protein, partial [Patescibacteria group bacterium]